MAAARASINPCIQIVTRETSPSSAGVVRAIARLGPLALRLDAEMGADLPERTRHEAAENSG